MMTPTAEAILCTILDTDTKGVLLLCSELEAFNIDFRDVWSRTTDAYEALDVDVLLEMTYRTALDEVTQEVVYNKGYDFDLKEKIRHKITALFSLDMGRLVTKGGGIIISRKWLEDYLYICVDEFIERIY